jgi:hypothetical protein
MIAFGFLLVRVVIEILTRPRQRNTGSNYNKKVNYSSFKYISRFTHKLKEFSMRHSSVRLRSSALTLAVVMILIILSSATYFQGIPVGAQLSANIVAPSVTGSVDLQNPGQEVFWSQIAPTQIPLTSSNDFGGATKMVTVRMASNGTHILVYATWSDPSESRVGHNTIEEENYPGLFYANSTYAYEDRIVFWWSLDQNPGPPPCMQKSAYGHGEGESLAGTGNLWHWKGSRTDSLGASFGKLKYGSGPNKGKLLIPLQSYADNEFINTTGHYQLGWDQYPTAAVPGNFTIGDGENSIPYNTFLVAAHGVYDSSTHTYKWVGARALTTTPTLHTVQFTSDRTFYFAVAVFDGGPIPIPTTVPHPTGWSFYGENEETKSISSWFTMAIGPAGVTSVSQSTTAAAPGGITFETAAVISFAMLLVGFVAGIAVIAWYAAPKKSKGASSGS